jgi:hypothetical protein
VREGGSDGGKEGGSRNSVSIKLFDACMAQHGVVWCVSTLANVRYLAVHAIIHG